MADRIPQTKLPAPFRASGLPLNAPPVYRPERSTTPLQRSLTPTAVGRSTVPLTPPPVYRAHAVNRPPAPPAAPQPATVQMMRITEKHVKNVATLGVRKLYVYIKRRRRAARQNQNQNQNPMIIPQQNQQPLRYREVYDRSVRYHSTRKENIPNIVEHGLLNQKDRIAKFEKDDYGMSAISSEYQGDEKKGVFLGTRRLALDNKAYMGPRVRIALPVERTNKPIGWGEDDEKPTGSDDTRLFYDEKFRGGGLFTPASISPDYIWSGKFTALAESENPADQRKVEMICRAIASHFPNPQPTWQEVLEAHLQAIDDGEVSDEDLEGRLG